jgi:hypothetical protein
MYNIKQQMHSIYLLLNLLRSIDDDYTIQIINNHYDINNPLVNAAKYLANEILIDNTGYPNMKNIDTLISKGICILPSEIDSIGWLSVYIQLSRGIIIFG